MRLLLKSLILLVVPFAFSTGVQAQEEGGDIAFHYVLTPKAGHEDQFRDAMKAHMKWRAENGDSWRWNAYDVVAGHGSNKIHFRSWGHKWADMDAYQSGEFRDRANANFEENVAEHLKKGMMFIDKDDDDISAWPTEGYYPLIQLVGHRLKHGMVRQWYDAAKTIHGALQAGGFDQHYGFSWTLVGGKEPYVTLVLFSQNWAGFAEPDPTVYDIVVEQLGEEEAKAAFQAFSGAIASAESWMVRHNKDLSTPSKE
ncbi:MAG: hypothetical protein PVF65_08500 [Sphingomonadales bacterium]|jgi:hypothetical protein